MKIYNVIIAILIVSMIVLGSTTYLTDLSTNYSESIDYSGLNKTSQRLDETKNITDTIKKNFEDLQMRKGITSLYLIPYDLIKMGVNSIKLAFGSIGTISAIFSDASKISAQTGINAPSWLLPTVISMIVLLFLFIVIYAFFKWRLET